MACLFDFVHVRKVSCEFAWREDGSTTISGQTEKMNRTEKLVYERYAFLRGPR
jgi:hypothetical protein